MGDRAGEGGVSIESIHLWPSLAPPCLYQAGRRASARWRPLLALRIILAPPCLLLYRVAPSCHLPLPEAWTDPSAHRHMPTVVPIVYAKTAAAIASSFSLSLSACEQQLLEKPHINSASRDSRFDHEWGILNFKGLGKWNLEAPRPPLHATWAMPLSPRSRPSPVMPQLH